MPQLLHLVAILVFIFAAQAQPLRSGESRKTETIAPGVEHIEIERSDSSSAAPEKDKDRWKIHALVVDPRLAGLKLAQAMDEIAGAETTSSMAARHKAVAAVNGGYFRTTGVARGEPVGMLAIGGKLLSEPVRQRAALAVADDGKNLRLSIARVDFKAGLRVDGKPAREINGFNRPRENDELIVFTPEFHRTTLTGPEGVEITVERGRVVSLIDGAGSQPIPHNGWVISASGKAKEWALANLKRGMRVEIRTEVVATPAIPFKPDFIIGAGPQLLASGGFVAEAEAANYSQSLMRLRHPRTAIGRREDGRLILVTVDGRQPQKSVGMTIEELAKLMLELGCREALNLDGGGSTTMVIKNRIVNSPSDQIGERPVSDALLVFTR
jgi:exopolysaccharide biosynthesis protein